MDKFHHLKSGDCYDRLRYIYLTKLKRFAWIRKIREFISSPTGKFIQMFFLFVPCLIILFIWLPILWVREKRQDKWLREHMDDGWK